MQVKDEFIFSLLHVQNTSMYLPKNLSNMLQIDISRKNTGSKPAIQTQLPEIYTFQRATPALVGHEGLSFSPPSISIIDCSLPNDVIEAIHLHGSSLHCMGGSGRQCRQTCCVQPCFFRDGSELRLFYNN